MKRLARAAVYTSVTSLALVLFFFSAFTPGNPENGRLNSVQIISGVVLLLLAIVLPAWKNIQKSASNK
jgi:hypothetical protein